MNVKSKQLVELLLQTARRHGVEAVWSLRKKCKEAQCRAYHEIRGIAATPDGRLFYLPSPYGHGSIAFPKPEPVPLRDAEEAARTAREILTWARQTEPFLGYFSADQPHVEVIRDDDGKKLWVEVF